jgi:hypothetical protein
MTDVQLGDACFVVMPVRASAGAGSAFKKGFKGQYINSHPTEIQESWRVANYRIGDDREVVAAVTADSTSKVAEHEVAPAFIAAAVLHKHFRRQLQRVAGVF